jgi:hypothetical protein
MLHRVILVGSLAVFSVCVWVVACCMCCRRALRPRAEKRAVDDVGQYRITLPGTVVKDGASLSSAYKGRLEEGQLVEVTEVTDKPSENRVRARISYGGQKGWISLRSLDGELVWARRADPCEQPSLDVPTYWENWRPQGGTVPKEFTDVFQVRQVDLAAVQGILDDWADRLSVSEPNRLRVRRVERNENSRVWRKYARGQATLHSSSTLATSTSAGHSSGSDAGLRRDVPDYRSRFPIAMLNTSVNETYLFRRCDFYQVPQVCGDGFVTDVASSSPFMRLSESPYDVDAGNDPEPSPSVLGSCGRGDTEVSIRPPSMSIRPPSCDEVLLSTLGWYDMGGSDGRGVSDDRPCIAMFRAVVGAAPLHWVDSEAHLQNVLSGVAVHSSGPGMPRTFFTQARELVYPEYIVYLEQGTHDLDP